jgi:peptide deformylase
MKTANRTPRLLPIRIYGDRVLQRKAEPVQEITTEISEFIHDLVHTMYETDGVGLAAPQVGISQRIFVVDVFWFKEDGKKNPIILINPEFLEFEGMEEAEEGCLSFPDIYEKVPRAAKVKIRGLNENGEMVSYEADGLFARALQHEADHLDGVFFIDKINRMRKILIRKKLKELAASTDENGVNIGRKRHHDYIEL